MFYTWKNPRSTLDRFLPGQLSDVSRILFIFVVYHIPLGTIKFTSLKGKKKKDNENLSLKKISCPGKKQTEYSSRNLWGSIKVAM